MFGGRFQDSNYGDRKSPRPGVVEPLPNGRTPWLEKMAVILTTYCKCFFFLEGNTTLPETEDPWNIDAYLVHERAHVYSMELRDPQVS